MDSVLYACAMKNWNSYDIYINFFLKESYFKGKLKLNWIMFGKKNIQNLKSSYLCYFMEKNHEMWNVNSNMGFLVLFRKKKQYFLISCKKDHNIAS